MALSANGSLRWFGRLPSLLAVALACGCATAGNRVKIARYGTVDVTADEALEEKAESLPWQEDYPVVVLRGTLPEGVSVDEDGKISIDGSSSREIEVLGTVESEVNGSALLTSSAWYVDVHPTEGGARDWFCKVQLPLRLATLTLWSFVTPFGWVCIARPVTGDDGFKFHLQELRRAAHAMGGNTVVLVGRTDLVKSSGGVEVGRVEGVKVLGLVLKTADPGTLALPAKER